MLPGDGDALIFQRDSLVPHPGTAPLSLRSPSAVVLRHQRMVPRAVC